MKINLLTFKKLLASIGVIIATSGNLLICQITNTFSYTGASQSFTVPSGVVSLSVDAKGAKGGDGNNGPGGNGGRVQTVLTVTPGEVLQINVGGASLDGNAAGGFNGGGAASSSFPGYMSGGGGGSDIRQGGTSLGNRIMVAGGGGGGGFNGCGENGGAGGGLIGGSGTGCGTSPTGGTQLGGGSAGAYSSYPSGTAGTLGFGGNGANGTGGAGGGGGYYGGGGGSWSGGGGGSSYSNGSNTTHTPGYNVGDGVISFTYVSLGAALNFDGSNDYVNLGNSLASGFTTQGKVTLEAWVMPTTTVNLGVIVGNYSTGSASMQFLLRRDFNAYAMWVDCGAGYQVVTGGTVTVNTWQHVAGVWDGSTLKLFVNGLAVGTTAGVTGTGLPSSTNPIWIGGNTISELFTGNIDEVRIWKRALCQGEIQNNKLGELSLPQPSLVAYYKFNQGISLGLNPTITTLTDASISSLNGTLNNFALSGATSNWTEPGSITSGSNVSTFVGPVISASSGAICTGQSFTITASGASTYTYSGGSSVIAPTTNTTINVTGTNSVGCVGSNTAVSSITVNVLPVVSVNSGSICNGQSFTISASGANTYTYSGGSSIVAPTTNTVYNITGTSAQGCVSSNTAASGVTVNTVPVISVNSGSICTGNSFTMVPSGANTYTYSNGSAVAAPLTNTVYNITGTSAQGCVSSNTAVSSVTVNITPTISVNSGSICAGKSFTILPTGANTYTYSGGSSIVAPTTNTAYNVTGTSAQGCVGSNTAVSSVTVNTVPVISVNSGSICAGNSFTMVPSGASTYTYSNGSAVVAPLTNTIYNVTGTSAQGCVGSNTAASTVTVNTVPTISVNSGSICAGNSFTMIPSGASTYTYSNGSAVAAPLTNTVYNVTGTSAQGCVASNTAASSVTVNTVPVISVNSGSICAGSSFTMVPSGASTYTYSNGSAVAAPLTNTVYNVTGTSAQGCAASNTAASTVTVNAVPTISVNSGSICAGKLFTITASGANTYTYSGGSSIVGPTTNTIYNVTGTSAQGCVSSNTAASSVTVNAVPTISVNSGSICTGNSFTMIPSGASTYTYSNGSAIAAPLTNTVYNVTGTSAQGCVSSNTAVSTVTVYTTPVISVNSGSICAGQSFIIIPTGATTFTYAGGSATITPTATNGYSVIGSSTAGCVSASVVSTVSVIANPTVIAVAGNTAICIGVSTSLTASGANTFSWSTGSINAIIGVTPNITSTYTVTGTSNSCSNTKTVSVVVNANPNSVITFSNVLCNNAGDGVANSAANGGNGPYSYSWSPGGFTSATAGNLIPGTYTCVVTDANNCKNSQTITISQPSAITSSVINTLAPGCGLSNGAATVTAAGGTGVLSYTWLPTGGNAAAGASMTAGSYTCFIKDANNCLNTVTQILSNPNGPTITATSSNAGCANETHGIITLTVTGGTPVYTYSWTPNVSTTVNASGLGAGVYSVLVSDINNCIGTQVYTLTELSSPTVVVTSSAIKICSGETATLTAAGATTYSWSTTAVTNSITVSPVVTTSYTVIAQDNNGCSDTTTVSQNVDACTGLGKNFLQVFTIKVYPNPNNGEFIVSSETDINLSIFNDLGQIVKSITLSENNNRSASISEMPNGIYFIAGQNNTEQIKQKIIVSK